jgi:hypothetical protein
VTRAKGTLFRGATARPVFLPVKQSMQGLRRQVVGSGFGAFGWAAMPASVSLSPSSSLP